MSSSMSEHVSMDMSKCRASHAEKANVDLEEANAPPLVDELKVLRDEAGPRDGGDEHEQALQRAGFFLCLNAGLSGVLQCLRDAPMAQSDTPYTSTVHHVFPDLNAGPPPGRFIRTCTKKRQQSSTSK